MSHKFLLNASFHSLLNAIDQELAGQALKKGCSHCGGKLHQADYPRSPFGIPQPLRSNYEQRLSFCCSNCRRRTTPPSVRFFGRRWFPAPVLVLISVLTLGISKRRLAQIKRHFGIFVSESTWKRWRLWWNESFVTTSFWQKTKGLLMPALTLNRPLPRELLALFSGTLTERMCLLLRLLSPITAGIFRAV